MSVKLATWNINSVRLRINLVERFADQYGPDVLCLQEIKCTDDAFPLKQIKALGFDHVEVKGQKGHHGVAICSRLPLRRLESQDFNGSGHARHVAVEIEPGGSAKPIALHNVYVPSGGDEPDPDANPKFRQKLDYLTAMTKWFAKQGDSAANRFALVGDFNVAPLETDVWSHKQLLKVVSHTPVEVAHLAGLMGSQDWVDVARQHIPPEERLFTWWSYRSRDWRASNRGRRLDHVWVTPPLAQGTVGVEVVDVARDWEKPSDHAPVIVEIDA
jgi:exodeoxyribonuclease-3